MAEAATEVCVTNSEGASDRRSALPAIALECGSPTEAIRHARRFLRQVPRGNHTARASALELIVLATAAATAPTSASASTGAGASATRGETPPRLRPATEELHELQALAERVESLALHASAALATAVALAADGVGDSATDAFEEAVAWYERAASPYDALRARLLLAIHLHQQGAREAASAEATIIASRAADLGAATLVSRADALLAQLSAPAMPPAATAVPGKGHAVALTAREREVLSGIVDGLTNRQIAARLSLSPHTVHRHVANVFTKLGLGTRAAAVAVGIRMGLGRTAG